MSSKSMAPFSFFSISYFLHASSNPTGTLKEQYEQASLSSEGEIRELLAHLMAMRSREGGREGEDFAKRRAQSLSSIREGKGERAKRDQSLRSWEKARE